MATSQMSTKDKAEQDSFSTILEQLQGDAQPSAGMDHWAAALGASWQNDCDNGQNRGSVKTAVTGYLDEGEPAVSSPNATTVEAVALELNLSGDLDADEIRRTRREFARLNHPDVAPDVAREAATLRMQIANELIDDALRRSGAQLDAD
jgi:hypothetical protein